MARLILTADIIADLLARTADEVCGPLRDSCLTHPLSLEQALTTVVADPWCLIGHLYSGHHHQDWEVWLNLESGDVQRRKRSWLEDENRNDAE